MRIRSFGSPDSYAGRSPQKSSGTKICLPALLVRTCNADQHGTATLSIQNISTSDDFTPTSNCGSSVNKGSQCTINVTFKPTAGGARNGELVDHRQRHWQSPVSHSLWDRHGLLGFRYPHVAHHIGWRSLDNVFADPDAAWRVHGKLPVSCSGAPAHTSCTFSPASVTINGSSAGAIATVETGVGRRTPRSTYKLTLTAAFGTLSHSVAVSLKVK